MADKQLKIVIAGDSSGAQKAMSGLGGTLLKLGAIATGAFSLAKIGGFFASANSEAREAQKTMAQTAAVLKSTGGVANVSANDVDKLSTSISNLTGIDDEAIAGAENLLLTFTNVKNGFGKGNQVFNDATRTITDMSVAMGTDLKSSTIQVGKALNDPIKGITALTKVGVSFTQQQKDQIKAMVKSGDVMGAQKVILAELSKEFGGSAAAQATAGDKAKVAWANFQEDIGKRLLPLMTKLATFITGTLLPVISQVIGVLFDGDFTGGPFEEDSAFIGGLFKAREIIQGIFDFVGRLVDAFQTGGFSAVFSQLGTEISNAWPAIQTALGAMLASIGSWIIDTAMPFVGEKLLQLGNAFWQWIQDATPPALVKLGEWLSALGSWFVETALPAMGAWALEMAGKLVDWVVTSAIPWLLEHLPVWLIQFSNWVTGTAIPKIIEFGTKMAIKLVEWVVTEAIPYLATNLPKWLGKLTDWVATDALPKLGAALKDMAVKALGELIKGLDEKLTAIKTWFTDLPGKAREALGNFMGKMYEIGVDMIQGMINGIGSMAGALGRKVKDVVSYSGIDLIKDVLGSHSPSQVFHEIGEDTMQGFVNGIGAKTNAVAQSMIATAGVITSQMKDLPGRAFDTGAAISASLAAGLNAPTDDVGRFLAAFEAEVNNQVNSITDQFQRDSLAPAINAEVRRRLYGSDMGAYTDPNGKGYIPDPVKGPVHIHLAVDGAEFASAMFPASALMAI
jgi:hypothetical protein